MVELKIVSQVNEAIQEFKTLPLQVDFGDVVVGKGKKEVIELTNADSTTSKIKIVSSPFPEYIAKTKIKKYKLKPGQSTKVEFSLAKDIPPGRFTTSLTIEAEGKSHSRYTIPIKGNIVVKGIKQAKAPGKK